MVDLRKPVPCVEALVKDFSNRWGSGKNVLTYSEGKRCQLQILRPEQLMTTALDPDTKILYGVEGHDLDHRVSAGCRNRGGQAGWPSIRHRISCNVGYSMCSSCWIRLGPQATQDWLYRSANGTRKTIVEHFIAPLIPGCHSRALWKGWRRSSKCRIYR